MYKYISVQTTSEHHQEGRRYREGELLLLVLLRREGDDVNLFGGVSNK